MSLLRSPLLSLQETIEVRHSSVHNGASPSSFPFKKYLREFFSVMLQSETSPLHINKVGLTLSKHTICEFSPFFKKGVFDYSSHGTG